MMPGEASSRAAAVIFSQAIPKKGGVEPVKRTAPAKRPLGRSELKQFYRLE
jgi:hypothetical protein